MNNQDSTQQHVLAPGSIIGHYKIIKLLGVGGMGQVYQAYDSSMKRNVALKTLLASSSPKARQRFMIEAQATACLNHSYIVQLYEISEQDGVCYFTMDHIEGAPLKDFIQEKKLSFQESVAIVKKIAQAMAYAHKQNIIHRDLKPANIIIDHEQKPHILDFGLAKMMDSPDKFTRTGSIMGTPAYMSPEQAQGKTHSIDKRSDIFSLGVILYEAITYKQPFEAPSYMKILDKVIKHMPPPPSQLNRRINKNFDKICAKAMAKKEKDRYQNAEDFIKDISFALLKKKSSHHQARKKKPLYIGLILIAILIVSFFLWPQKEVSTKKTNPSKHKNTSKVSSSNNSIVKKSSSKNSKSLFSKKSSSKKPSQKSWRLKSKPKPQDYKRIILKDNPLSYWRLDDKDHIAKDEKNRLPGTYKIGITPKIPGITKLNKAILCDGKKGHVNIASKISKIKKYLPKKQLTVEVWAKYNSLPSKWGGIVSLLQDNRDYEKGWMLGHRGHKITFDLATTGADDGNGKMTSVRYSGEIPFGVWLYIVGTYDGKKMALYVNGRLISTSTKQHGAILYDYKTPLNIGVFQDRNSFYLHHGVIDEVAIYNHALSYDQITKHFHAGLSNHD